MSKNPVQQLSYHAGDQCQGAGVIPHGDKLVTSWQIPVEGDVSCNVLSSVDSVMGLALAVDGGLYRLLTEKKKAHEIS